MLQLVTFSTLNGILYGMLLFMMASGLTLIFSMMGVLNFAHASFYMLGAYFGYEISRRLGFWTGLVAAPLIVGVLGALVERYGLRRVHRLGHLSELLFTFGLAFVIEELVGMFWGKLPVDYRPPPALDFVAFRIFGTNYPAYRMFILVVAAAMFVFLIVALRRTRVGLVIRASLTHPDMAAMLGHDVPGVFMTVFGVGSALAGLAGVLPRPPLFSHSRRWVGCWGRSCSLSSSSAAWARSPAPSSPRCWSGSFRRLLWPSTRRSGACLEQRRRR